MERQSSSPLAQLVAERLSLAAERTPSVEELVSRLNLLPHPEGARFVAALFFSVCSLALCAGGFYAETFRDELSVSVKRRTLDGQGLSAEPRAASTAIYFLLPAGHTSRLHRIRSSEVWHFYLGSGTLVVSELGKDGVKRTRLGRDVLGRERLQHVVPAGCWFGAYLEDHGDVSAYALVGCTVSPGFDFADFQLAKRRCVPHRLRVCIADMLTISPPMRVVQRAAAPISGGWGGHREAHRPGMRGLVRAGACILERPACTTGYGARCRCVE